MQSAWHNLPTVDGIMQPAGRQYEASEAVYKADDAAAELTLNIAKAWGPEAGIRSWKRTYRLDRRENQISIRESYALAKRPGKITLTLMTVARPSEAAAGILALEGRGKVSYDAKTFRPLPLPKLPEADNVEIAGTSHNGRFVQLAVNGSTVAPQSLIYDWQTRKLTTWRVPSTPEIDPRAFAKAQLEAYPARDGTKIPMFVWRPTRCDGACPVVVDFHGGPEGQSRAGFNGLAQLFVEAGFVFVQPNVRGSAGYGKKWLDSDNGPRRLAVITDIEDCAKHIRASWAKDGKPPKLGVMGGSYGGYSAPMMMVPSGAMTGWAINWRLLLAFAG